MRNTVDTSKSQAKFYSYYNCFYEFTLKTQEAPNQFKSKDG
jgi:hypothetical protein